MSRAVLVICLMMMMVVVVSATGAQGSRSVYDLISERPELSEFLEAVQSDSLMQDIMSRDEGTVFAPNNEAMKRYKAAQGKPDYRLVKYHMVNLALSVDELKKRTTVLTMLKGSQAIYVTVLPDSSSREEMVLFNNARLISGDLRATSEQDAQQQVLHIIDEVLMPTIPNTKDPKLYNPSALELMANSDKFSLGQASTSMFYQKVMQLQKQEVFNTRGYHTYFIPVDQHFTEAQDLVDRSVVDIHVIPNRALFTRSLTNVSYETLAFGDMLKATLRLHRRQRPDQSGGGTCHEVQSTVMVGDAVHGAGSALVTILQPNIAVKNGVIHLISRTLGVPPRSGFQFIQDGADDRFSEFLQLLESKAPEYLRTLRDIEPDTTLFVPSNQAFHTADQARLDKVKEQPEKLISLLDLHRVGEQVTTQTVRNAPQSELYSVMSEDAGQYVYLSAFNTSAGDTSLTVEGGGTNATVLVADIVARDGVVVHIIDKLLGVPYRSISQKLSVDVMMSDTSALAAQDLFAENVNQMDRQFTMFVPSNTAWDKLKVALPTTHLSLFTGKASHQANAILERHLVVGHAYSVDELVNITLAQGFVPTFKGNFSVDEVPATSEYILRWQSKQARIIRPNVQCTNGIIHVIDDIMMRARDVTTSQSPKTTAVSWSVCVLLAVWVVS